MDGTLSGTIHLYEYQHQLRQRAAELEQGGLRDAARELLSAQYDPAWGRFRQQFVVQSGVQRVEMREDLRGYKECIQCVHTMRASNACIQCDGRCEDASVFRSVDTAHA